MPMVIFEGPPMTTEMKRKLAHEITEAASRVTGHPMRIITTVIHENEQENIGACVRTLLEQDYPNFSVLVCNDRSEDDTGPIVSAKAALAAFTARSTSAALPTLTRPITFSVAGLMTSIAFDSSGSTHSPSM